MKLVTVPTAIFVLNISNMKLTSITYIDEKILDIVGLGFYGLPILPPLVCLKQRFSIASNNEGHIP